MTYECTTACPLPYLTGFELFTSMVVKTIAREGEGRAPSECWLVR